MSIRFSGRLFDNIPLIIPLIAPFIILTVLAVGLVGFLSFRNGQKAVNDVAFRLRNEITQRIDDHLHTFLNTPHQICMVNADAIYQGLPDANDPTALERHFWRQVRIFKSVTSIYFGNTQGGLVNSGREGATDSRYIIVTDGFTSGPFKKYATDSLGNRTDLLVTVKNFDARTRQWYAGAVEKGAAVWSPVYILFTGQDMAVAASRPVYNEQQKLLGVVSTDIFLSHVSHFLQNLSIGETGQAFIIERSGLLIASSTDEKPFTEPGGTEPQKRLHAGESVIPMIRHAAEALSKRPGGYHNITAVQHIEFGIDGRRQFLQVLPVSDQYGLDWLIVVVIPEADFMNQIKANNRVTAFFIVLTLMIAVIISVFTARMINRPIRRLQTSSQSLAKGEWTKAIRDDSRLGEISALTRSFNQMAGQLQQMLDDLNHEIAERMHTERELQESEEKYRILVENQTDLIVKFDTDGRLLFVNQPYCDTFGKTREQLIGKKFMPLIHEEDRESVSKAISEVCCPPYSSRIEERTMTKNGWRWQAWLNTAILDENRQVIAITAVGRDTTERKQTESALRHSEARLKAIFQASPIPIVVYEKQGLAQYFNPAFERVFGWSLEGLEGKRIPFVPDDQKKLTAASVHELYKTGNLITLETRRLTKDGRTLDILVNAALIREIDGEPIGTVVSLTDITAKKRFEAQYQAIQRMEAIGVLAGGIAHDFNNLLMAIQGNTSLMRNNLESGHPHHEKLGDIERCVRQGANLSRQLLEFARGGKYDVKPIDLNDIVKTQSELFGRTKKEIKIHETYEKDLWIVKVDQSQIEQVLLNIYINAWQAMPDGGDIYVQTKNIALDSEYVTPYNKLPGRYAGIAVTDTGTGMDETTREKIFEPFFTTKEIGGGTGMGLASAYGIMKNHGGFINVYSEPGKGATFNLYLPATDTGVIKPKAIQKESMAPGKGSETLLLVDDQAIVTRVGKKMLESLGYTVFTAQHGKEAIDACKKYKDKIDLVILDMIMPEMGGKETYERLLEIDPEIKVLLSSGYSINGQAQEILDRGCNGFIQKPFTMRELSRKVREVLHGKGKTEG